MTDDVLRPSDELAGPPVAVGEDEGPALLDAIRGALQMDDEWVDRGPRTLTWWADAVPLTFTVGKARVVKGDPTVKLTTSAIVLTDVTASTPAVLQVLEQVNRIASTGAFVWLEDDRRIDAFLTHYHSAGVAHITERVSAYGLLLYGEVFAHGRYLAEQLTTGPRGLVAHPQSGVRGDYDEMMTFTEQFVIPAGQRPNRWYGHELVTLAEQLTADGVGIATGSPDGLSVEYPLARNSSERWQRLDSHHTAAAEWDGDPIESYFSMPTASLHLSCVEHPIYSAGLVSLLRFPLRVDYEGAYVANEFNLGEYHGSTRVPSIGAWCTDPQGGLVHTAFAPNFYYAPWLAPNLAYWAGARTQWAFEAFAPDLVSGAGA